MSIPLAYQSIAREIEKAALARGGKVHGDEIVFLCPANQERDARAYYNTIKGVWNCFRCGESGNYYDLGRRLGVINNGHAPDGWQLTRQWNVGKHVHKRLEKGGDKQVVWDGGLHGLGTANLPLYGIENVTNSTLDVLVNEGEKSTDPLIALGFQAVGSACGAQTTPCRDSLKPLAEHKGRVILCQDNDEPGKKHMQNIAARLKAMGKVAYLLEWPDAKEKGDAYDYIKSGHSADDVRATLDGAREYEGEAEPSPYIVDGARGPALDQDRLVTDLLADFTFKTLKDTDEILVYQDGYYQANGARLIKAECQRRIGVNSLLTEHKVNEVVGHIRRSTYTDRALFNANKEIINLTNGLLNVRTRQLSDHTAEYLSTIRIPLEFVSGADCPRIRQFFGEVHHAEDVPVVVEEFGYCLIPDYSIQKAFLDVGDGENGKSTELNLLKGFIGKENCSNVPWQALELNRFAKSALEGKLVNIFADLPSQSLDMTSNFKMLTGNDAIGTEKKFGDYYSFTNFARLIFSANKPPRIKDEDSFAFWRRWVIIDFPNQFSDDKKDLDILAKLTAPAELSGLLNLALDGLDRLRLNHGFSYKKTVDETSDFYMRAADPVYAFIQRSAELEALKFENEGFVTKDNLYQLFLTYCKVEHTPTLKPNAFARALQNLEALRVKSSRPTIGKERVTAWQGLSLGERVKDVKDVNVFSISSCLLSKSPNTQVDKSIGKNNGNPDNPDSQFAYPTGPCPNCGREDFGMRESGAYYCQNCNADYQGG